MEVWTGILAALSLALVSLNARVQGQDVECFPIQPGSVSLRPRPEEVVQMVTQAFNNRVAKNEDDEVQDSQVAEAGYRTKRSTNEMAREKRSSHNVECPKQEDQSAPYILRSDPKGYPIELISAELFQRSLPGTDLLFQCLARQVIQENAGPVVKPQPLLVNGTTCPQRLSQLWTYNSVNLGNILCWALANFQEDILFNAKCMGKPCLGCGRFYPSMDFDTEIRKTCLPLYRTVSLWAFCPSLPLNNRVVRDRIIIPSDCSCVNVKCKRNRFRSSYDFWDHPLFNNH